MLVPEAGFLQAVHDMVDVSHGLVVVGAGDYGNVEVTRGYVITCRPAAAVAVAPTAVP